MKKFDTGGSEWQIGNTKVFLRERLEVAVEHARTKAIKATMQKIQAVILGYVERKRYQNIRRAIIVLQAWWKMIFQCSRYRRQLVAAIKIQSVYRGYRARVTYARMLEQKRIEEKRRREEERRREEARLVELARLERLAHEAAQQEAAQREAAERALAEARAQAEAENKARAAEEERLRIAAERQMKEMMARAKDIEVKRAQDEEERRRQEEETHRIQEAAQRQKELEAAQRQAAAQAQADLARADAELEAERQRELEEARYEDAECDFEEGEEYSEYREGYLGMYRGVMKNLKKRWCVLHEGTFMWFKGKQDFIKAGWLTKMGGGTSTLGRKSWKRRWMTLKGGQLTYHPSEDDNAEVLGTVDVQHCERIIHNAEDDIPGKKEHALAIQTAKRTYVMYAETAEECQEWCDVLNSVKGKSDAEIQNMMMDARVDARNAQGTIEVDDILSAGPANKTDADGHPIFVVLCSDRVFKFVAADAVDMEDWARCLTPRKVGQGSSDAHNEEITERGWMLKTGGSNNFKRRRWFVLRGDVISYYKTKSDDFTVGSIPLNSLCSVIPPDDAAASRNEWTFTLHSRRKSFELTCKTQADCNRWINAIQDVIDNSPVIETPFEKLIDDLKLAGPQEVEALYATHKVLTSSSEPLRSPLLPMSYGVVDSITTVRAYGTLQEEAIKISTSLLPVQEPGKGSATRYGTPADPIPLIKAIAQACFDVPKLRNEVYCQLIRLTTNVPDPGSPLAMTHWHMLGALCCSFLPSRKLVRFLRFHLRRTLDMEDRVGTDAARAASFCLEALKHTKTRDFPPSSAEVKGIMSGGGLTINVHCVGGRDLQIPVTSSTSCGEVIGEIKRQLGLIGCRNGFGLFENCGSVDKYLEDKYVVADILSKWEKYEAHGIMPDGGTWALVFKLFSFYDALDTNLTKTEQEFLFEQAFESVMQRRYPADADMLIKLAALRTQFIIGPYEDGAYISDLVKVHPSQQEQLLAQDSGGALGTLKKAGTMLKGTLKGFGKNTLKRLTGGTIKKGLNVSDAELAKIKEKIVGEWKKLKGLDKDGARLQYMDIVQSWDGYGSNLFEVEQSSNKHWPKELWLAISLNGVGIYVRGERKRLAFYRYETVLSFGAPVANKYKIMVDNVGSMLFETPMVLEIAKLMKEYIKEIVTRRR